MQGTVKRGRVCRDLPRSFFRDLRREPALTKRRAMKRRMRGEKQIIRIMPGHVILRACYPADLAHGIRPFVDLLLTRGLERKKPPAREALKLLI